MHIIKDLLNILLFLTCYKVAHNYLNFMSHYSEASVMQQFDEHNYISDDGHDA